MKFTLLAAALAATVLTVPAHATSAINVVDGSCISVSNAAGCRFTGNITAQTVGQAQAAYNLYNDSLFTAQPDITLNYLFDTDNGLPDTATVTNLGGTAGTWSTPGYLVEFLGVKAANGFTLFKLATPMSSGSWATGVKNGLSHLSFMGSAAGELVAEELVGTQGAIPEPSSWAMLIAGFGLTGLISRRRRRDHSVAH